MPGWKCGECGQIWPKLGEACVECGNRTRVPRGQMRRSRMSPMSDQRRAENKERHRVLLDHFGRYPDCALCEPLRAHGVETGCNGKADDADELLRRSAGGSITDVTNIRPVGRRCHDWITTHPREAREWRLELRP